MFIKLFTKLTETDDEEDEEDEDAAYYELIQQVLSDLDTVNHDLNKVKVLDNATHHVFVKELHAAISYCNDHCVEEEQVEFKEVAKVMLARIWSIKGYLNNLPNDDDCRLTTGEYFAIWRANDEMLTALNSHRDVFKVPELGNKPPAPAKKMHKTKETDARRLVSPEEDINFLRAMIRDVESGDSGLPDRRKSSLLKLWLEATEQPVETFPLLLCQCGEDWVARFKSLPE